MGVYKLPGPANGYAMSFRDIGIAAAENVIDWSSAAKALYSQFENEFTPLAAAAVVRSF